MNLHTHPAADLGPATVLAVDDSKSNRLLLKMTLNKFGHRVLEAENGLKAFEVLAEQRGVDLIILDLLMPQMNGFEFLKARQDKPEVKAIPVIINSSLDDFESIAQALAMGAYDYFTKPLSPDDLKTVLPLKIRNAVTARRLMAETSRQNEIMRRELEIAARYQRFPFAPRGLPARDRGGLSLPALHRSGGRLLRLHGDRRTAPGFRGGRCLRPWHGLGHDRLHHQGPAARAIWPAISRRAGLWPN